MKPSRSERRLEAFLGGRLTLVTALRSLVVGEPGELVELHETMHGNIPEARQALQSVLESPLIMTPREDSSGREYAITGRLVLGEALALDAAPSPDQTRGLGTLRPRRDSNPC